MGSFPVAGFDVACRAEYLRAKLDLLRVSTNNKYYEYKIIVKFSNDLN